MVGLNVSDAVFFSSSHMNYSWERFCCNDCVSVMMAVFFFLNVLLSDWLQGCFCCDSVL